MTDVQHTTLRTTRQRLPNRRLNETVDLHFEGQRYHATVGRFADGRPGEVFCHGGKVGSSMDLILDDACVALSLLLQHGVEPQALAHSMGRLENGVAEQAQHSINIGNVRLDGSTALVELREFA